jgi:hypothetical protein
LAEVAPPQGEATELQSRPSLLAYLLLLV